MLLVSFLLVIVATIFLLSGLFLTKDLALIFISIACSAVAGIVLVLAVMKSRPRPGAVPATDGAGATGPSTVSAADAPAAERRAAATRPSEGREFPIPDYDAGVRDFPIHRYDELRVTEILPLLSTLDADDLKMVRKEEAAGKARASILSRIDGLLVRDGGARQPAGAARRPAAKAPSRAAANLPIDGYDDLTVPQIQARLVGLTAAELRQVRTYEKRHKNRAGVLSRIEGALKQAPR